MNFAKNSISVRIGIPMNLRFSIAFFIICLMFLSSCSITRRVPEGEYLLRRTDVRFYDSDPNRISRILRSDPHWQRHFPNDLNTDPPLSRSDFIPLQRQEPNTRFAMIPLRLRMYNSVNLERDSRWTRFMQRVGEPPVILDNAAADQSARQMQQHLINNGHFNSEIYHISYASRRRPQQTRVVFYINPGQGYSYRNVSLDVRDDSLRHLFDDWSNQTLIRSGQSYSVEVLEAERSRVTRKLQNLGYFDFRRESVEFLIDSALNAYQMDITMIINPPRSGGNHQTYTFADVYIFPDERANFVGQKQFDTTTVRLPKSRRDTTLMNFHFVHTRPLQIRPNVIASKLAIQPGAKFSPISVDRTYENLLDLRVFRSTNIMIQPQFIDTLNIENPQNLLNTTIEMQQALSNTWEIDFETMTTDGLQGLAFNTSLQSRNLFGGAEIFNLRLRGLMELQYLLNPELAQRVDNWDIGISAVLDIPRFVAPFPIRQTFAQRTRTLISLNYSYRWRPAFYNRWAVGASFAYSWRQPRSTHTFFPLDVNLVNISLNPRFDSIIRSQNNPRLLYQYKDHFIFAMRYSFSFSGEQPGRARSFNAFRFSVESSGNSLSLLSNLINAPKNESGQYQFFHLGYAQYVRGDADFRRHWRLTDNQTIVTRLMGGVGFAYGNSMIDGQGVLPYEKGFFAGGSNNVRAWPMNLLGPGSFSNSDNLNIERIGDIVLVGNIEYRFPIAGAFKGALFIDAGNIWLREDSEVFPNGEFRWRNIPRDLAVGGGFGLRLDLGFFAIRLDMAIPLRDPAMPNGEKWVIQNARMRDFVFNFGIGYPF